MTDSSIEENSSSVHSDKEVKKDIEKDNEIDESSSSVSVQHEENSLSSTIATKSVEEKEKENEIEQNEDDVIAYTEEIIDDMEAPPLPPPKMPEDTVWEACWDENSKNYYFWNTETDEVTWDNPFEGIKINDDKDKNNKDKDDDDGNKENNNGDDSENYEIEVEGYEEALAEQQKREQEEKDKENNLDKDKNSDNTNNNDNNSDSDSDSDNSDKKRKSQKVNTTIPSTTQPIYPYTDYTNAAATNPNYYYGYGGGYDSSQYYYNLYDYSQYSSAYPTASTTAADKDTLSNFDSLLNKIDDVKEKLDDLSGVKDTQTTTKSTINDKTKEENSDEAKKDETTATTETNYASESAWPTTDAASSYWNYSTYGYPTPEAAGGSTFQEYSVTGYFNKRTGRFQNTSNEMLTNPKEYFTPESKGERQMHYYFNPEDYQQQYNQAYQQHQQQGMDQDLGGGKRKLSRKEIEHFKKMKKRKRDEKLKKKIKSKRNRTF
jgi:hypothetical protein